MLSILEGSSLNFANVSSLYFSFSGLMLLVSSSSSIFFNFVVASHGLRPIHSASSSLN